MERLRKTAEWLPPSTDHEAGDYFRENYFPVIEISAHEAETTQEALHLATQTLLEFAKQRKIKPNKIWTAYDIDYVLRNPPRQLSQFCPGRLPQSSITTLKKLEAKGVKIKAFVTNQPLEGHQVAKIVGRAQGYTTIQESLSTNFPDSEVISAEKDWRFIWQRPKASLENTDRLSALIKESNSQLFAFFGDRYDVDARFWADVQERVAIKENQFVFVKLPDPAIKKGLVSHFSFLIP